MRAMASATGSPWKKVESELPFQWSPVESARVRSPGQGEAPSCLARPGQCLSSATHLPSICAAPPLGASPSLVGRSCPFSSEVTRTVTTWVSASAGGTSTKAARRTGAKRWGRTDSALTTRAAAGGLPLWLPPLPPLAPPLAFRSGPQIGGRVVGDALQRVVKAGGLAVHHPAPGVQHPGLAAQGAFGPFEEVGFHLQRQRHLLLANRGHGR